MPGGGGGPFVCHGLIVPDAKPMEDVGPPSGMLRGPVGGRPGIDEDTGPKPRGVGNISAVGSIDTDNGFVDGGMPPMPRGDCQGDGPIISPGDIDIAIVGLVSGGMPCNAGGILPIGDIGPDGGMNPLAAIDMEPSMGIGGIDIEPSIAGIGPRGDIPPASKLASRGDIGPLFMGGIGGIVAGSGMPVGPVGGKPGIEEDTGPKPRDDVGIPFILTGWPLA